MRLEVDKNITISENSLLKITNEDSYHLSIDSNNPIYLDIHVYNNCNLTIDCKENSNVELLIVSHKNNLNLEVNVFNNSNVTGIIGHFGNSNINDLINLNEEYARCELKMVAMANEMDNLNINARLEHNYTDTFGSVKAYCVTNGCGKIIFDGINHIAQGKARSNSNLHIRGMILSETSKIAANPALLIDEYDVKANHGATVGKISDEGLYYLMSRGITKADATKLIISGFLIPIVENIKNEDSKEYFQKLADLNIKE